MLKHVNSKKKGGGGKMENMPTGVSMLLPKNQHLSDIVKHANSMWH